MTGFFMSYFFTHIQTPIGTITLCADGDFLSGLYFENHKNMPAIGADRQHNPHAPIFLLVEKQIAEYFHGKRRVFNVPCVFNGGTEFQQKVWRALADIPYGATLSYRVLAEKIGCPQSIRAVAHAVGRNPISILIPCHRVIGSDESLVGYAGGLERKQKLSALERKIIGA